MIEKNPLSSPAGEKPWAPPESKGRLSFFVVGAMRSGTTLLRQMLTHHRRIHVPEESHFIPYLFLESRRVGRLDPDWFFREGFPFHHHPGVGDYVPQAREVVSTTFGARLRRVPEGFGFSRSELVKRLASRPSYQELVGWMFERALARDPLVQDPDGKRIFGDKTPHYVRRIPVLRQLYPSAVIVHLVRDGRAVLCSKSIAKRLLTPPSDEADRLVAEVRRRVPGLRVEDAVFGFDDDGWARPRALRALGVVDPPNRQVLERVDGCLRRLRRLWRSARVETQVLPRAVRHQAKVWAADVEAGRQADLTLHYEDLVRDPWPHLVELCRALGIAPDRGMLEYWKNPRLRWVYGSDFGALPGNRDVMKPPRPENIDKWRRLLPAAAVEEFQAEAGPTLERFGYSLQV